MEFGTQNKVCAVLGFAERRTAISYRSSGQLIGSISRVKTSLSMKMEPRNCFETSVRNYHPTYRKNRIGQISFTRRRKPEFTRGVKHMKI